MRKNGLLSCYLFVLHFLLTFSSLQSEVKLLPLCDSEQESSQLINNSVSPISGAYVETHTDIIMPGPEPLTFERFYSSSDYTIGTAWCGWHHNHLSYMTFEIDETIIKKDFYLIKHVDPIGSSAIYSTKYGYTDCKIDQKRHAKGLTNMGGGIISARTNLKNNTISIKNGVSMSLGSGEEREYTKAKGNPFGTLSLYVLKSSNTPHGNKISYSYMTGKDEPILENIKATTNNGNVEYANLNFSYLKKERGIELKTSDGRSSKYIYMDVDTGMGTALLVGAYPAHKPWTQYEYTDKSGILIKKISKVKHQDGYYRNIEYYKEGDRNGNTYVSKGDPILHRVKQQSEPVGKNGAEVVTHRYSYDQNRKREDHQTIFTNGTTQVVDAFNHSTFYHYNEQHRLFVVEKFGGKGLLLKKYFIWGDEGSQDTGNLKAKLLTDVSNKIHCARSFIYDKLGNITEEYLYGNFTGTNNSGVELEANLIPKRKNASECLTKKYTYSNDNLNLLLSEEEVDERHKKTVFAYKPKTDLLIAKYVYEGDIIRLREFHTYNDLGVLIETITDDGSSLQKDDLKNVTERHITEIDPKPKAPGLGLPIETREYAFDFATGKKILIKRLVNTYTLEGHITRQEYYDSNNQFKYALTWEYDNHCNVIKEQNALGQVTTREYNLANDTLKKEIGPDGILTKEHYYDLARRLIKTIETHKDGTTFSTTFDYDVLSNKISSTDTFGNTTYYAYDDFGRVISTIYPAVMNENGIMQTPKITQEYDIFSNVKSTTDALGNTTSTDFNLYGKPIAIRYPDLTSESFEYNIDGTLKKSVAKNGTVTKYSYDFLQRPTSIEIYAKDGQLLSKVTKSYNALHQLSETDAEGQITYFSYDCVGRLISERKNNQLKTYEYDSLGHCFKTVDWVDNNPQHALYTIQEFDLLEHVTQERLEDGAGTIIRRSDFQYDAHGNKTHVIEYPMNKQSITQTIYNGYNLPVTITDPLGNVTKIDYNYSYLNDQSQYVLQTIKTDALGCQEINTYDALHRVVSTIFKNSLGVVIGQQKAFYDLNSKRTKLVDSVITPGVSERKEQITSWIYNAMGDLLTHTEAKGNEGQKEINIRYNSYGQKEQLIKADGTILQHTYDPLGRLQNVYSSDNSVNYEYHYDKLNRPILVKDLINNKATIRKYEKDCLVDEKLNNDLSIQYSYDNLNRPISITLPDRSGIDFDYGASILKQVKRRHSNGTILYSHAYESWDQSGHLLSAKLPLNLGSLSFSYDLMSRLNEITSTYWSQTIPSDGFDAVGNLTHFNTKDIAGTIDALFAYDDRGQLTNESGVVTHAYTNDSLYNRVTKDTQIYKTNLLNQLLSDDKYTFTYDPNGNLKTQKADNSEKVKQFDFDAMDRLTTFTFEDRQVRYTYDSFNRRMSQEIYSKHGEEWILQTRALFLYQGDNEIGKTDAQGNILQLRLLGIGKGAEIAASVAIEINNKAYAPIHDQSGHIACLVDINTGQVAENYRYTAFGEEVVCDSSGKQMTESKIGNPWRFSSKRKDEFTNLINFGRRYYMPEQGRWLTQDPKGLEGGPNLYAYVLNNPLTHFDLYGLKAQYNSKKPYLKSSSSRQNGPRKNPVQFIGQVLGMFHHFVPIPYLHTVYSRITRFIAGDAPFKPEHSHNNFVGTSTSDRVAVRNAMGMVTYEESQIIAAEKISKSHGGTKVGYTVNSTHGFFGDLFESFCNMFSIPTHVVEECAKGLRESCASVGPDGRVIQYAYSQGGLIVHNALKLLSPEERGKIFVVTFGSAKMIEKGDLAGAINYVSWTDFVPFVADTWGVAKGLFSKSSNVVFLKSNDLPFCGHKFNSDAYQNALKEHGRNFIKDYGVGK